MKQKLTPWSKHLAFLDNYKNINLNLQQVKNPYVFFQEHFLRYSTKSILFIPHKPVAKRAHDMADVPCNIFRKARAHEEKSGRKSRNDLKLSRFFCAYYIHEIRKIFLLLAKRWRKELRVFISQNSGERLENLAEMRSYCHFFVIMLFQEVGNGI